MAITPPAFFTPNETCASGHHRRLQSGGSQQTQRLSRQMLSGSVASSAMVSATMAEGEEADEILGYYGFGLSGECAPSCVRASVMPFFDVLPH
jgi:hypothetical protein